jgi:hypothetical protein
VALDGRPACTLAHATVPWDDACAMSQAYRHPSEPFPQPPDSTPDFAAMRRRRRRRILVACAAGCAVLVAAACGIHYSAQRAARRSTEGAAGELRTCLFHGSLAGEAPSVRFRRLQLAAMSLGQAERVAPGAVV